MIFFSQGIIAEYIARIVPDIKKRPKYIIEKKYPRAYLSITEPMREMGLYFFLKMADAQQKNIKEIIELNSNPDDSKKSLKYAIELIKKNGIGAGSEIWIGGVPLKFELSRFVENYAKEKTFKEWRKILNDIGKIKNIAICEGYNSINKIQNFHVIDRKLFTINLTLFASQARTLFYQINRLVICRRNIVAQIKSGSQTFPEFRKTLSRAELYALLWLHACVAASIILVKFFGQSLILQINHRGPSQSGSRL